MIRDRFHASALELIRRTSAVLPPDVATVLLRAVVGKGGMGPKTLKACQEHGCVYLHAIGGAAQIYARCVRAVPNVYLTQFGSPEAVWEMRVEDFPAVVTMDAHGRSLHQEVADDSQGRLREVLGAAGKA
jgi:tartrate/fumarate subfamily iron-sulfur-dependent hydro-lyase beta chain